MEDGINEYGLAVGLTFVYPQIKEAGFNAGMLVRYLLEKCKKTSEVIECLNTLPIASQQTLTVIDSIGNFAVIECNCRHVEVIQGTEHDGFVVAANAFVSPKMKEYNNPEVDNWHSDERYFTVCQALKENKKSFCIDLAKDILSGKYGFMCQYDRKTGADTVWSVIYDIRNRRIFRVEGNPSRRQFREDSRMKFIGT